jgi:hypothetical protein
MVPGAPLPDSMYKLPLIDKRDIEEELLRAEIELMYALSRHRKAWRVMRQRAEHRATLADHVGMLSTLESDPHWKKATGDVSWWRDEVTAQATAILALRGMRE